MLIYFGSSLLSAIESFWRAQGVEMIGLREFVKTTVILAPGARCRGGANCTFPTVFGSVPDRVPGRQFGREIIMVLAPLGRKMTAHFHANLILRARFT